MFKIGVGPSSSHTLGPWKAARLFINSLSVEQIITSIQVELFGSLALTGKGHGTNLAVALGLMNQDPEFIDLSIVRNLDTENIPLSFGQSLFNYSESKHLIYHRSKKLPLHANGMKFKAYYSDGSDYNSTYYSIGGGFVLQENQAIDGREVPVSFCDTARDLAETCANLQLKISDLVYKNEKTWYPENEINAGLDRIYNTMLESIYTGCQHKGILPGGLNVKRRAPEMFSRLYPFSFPENKEEMVEKICKVRSDFSTTIRWVGCFAIAVNEENAGFGRIVTAPTNGASGVIPAVLLYFLCFHLRKINIEKIRKFLMTASEIGSLFKRHATISAAMGGCQAEIGVSSAMAAAGLAEGMGATVDQVLMAAEIAMEHHLGLTCDPIGGLVQIPCIERNSMGAMKAITAAKIALDTDPRDAKVSLDSVIKTMWETSKDMKVKYKETSKGGLASNISVKVPEC